MLEPNVIARIRHIFLHPRPHVSISQATDLLGWTYSQMTATIAAGEVELRTTPLAKWFPREELRAKALELWTLDLIEDALGPDAARVLPQALRTAELRVRVPRHHIDMLHYYADRDRTTVSGILTRELDGMASADADTLTAAIPNFAAALAWLDAEPTSLPR
jgi:hypothetical protein